MPQCHATGWRMHAMFIPSTLTYPLMMTARVRRPKRHIRRLFLHHQILWKLKCWFLLPNMLILPVVKTEPIHTMVKLQCTQMQDSPAARHSFLTELSTTETNPSNRWYTFPHFIPRTGGRSAELPGTRTIRHPLSSTVRRM